MFDEAHYWEGSLKLCEQLKSFYTNALFDFSNVSKILKRMAGYYDRIREADRFYPSTFRVGFYGSFGPEFKNCDFVYRGDILESIGDFTMRIKKKFPSAEVLGVKVDPGEEHRQGKDGKQYLQVSKVTPLSQPPSDESGLLRWVSDVLPKYARDSRNNSGVSKFIYSRPFRKQTTKSDNEFLDLWVENKILTTEEALPCTQRRSRVTKVQNVVVNPLENAVNEMLKKNIELKEK